MMKSAVASVLIAAVSACAAAPSPQSNAQAAEAFLWDYTRVWNTHDSAQIAEKFYRTGPPVAEQTVILEKQFEGLRAQGYKQSAIHAIKACMTGADTAWGGMRFSRLRADGEPLPPKDRASSYELKKFADGWRIVKLAGGDASQPLACPA